VCARQAYAVSASRRHRESSWCIERIPLTQLTKALTWSRTRQAAPRRAVFTTVEQYLGSEGVRKLSALWGEEECGTDPMPTFVGEQASLTNDRV
jgi:hypothetical protein